MIQLVMLLELGLTLLTPAWAQSSKRGNMTQVEVAAKHVQQFEETGSLETLNQAVQALVAAEPGAQRSGRFSGKRQDITKEWIAVIHSIDQHRDLAFDPADVPLMNIVPPTVKGVTYPSGVDPKAIPDAKLRAKYIKQLDENKRKAERHQFQEGLRRLDERASEEFQDFVRRSFREGEWNELERVLNESSLTPSRRQELLNRSRRAGFGR